ncbi:methyltransferase family protein [Bradyrhizobium canariense]|uniref:Protein-S-isoprenylcysteine O-methyltransferase Ste14 n=1 Tax=Bradyrhizobium canariense TaxID=255045 RepID=A0A1H1MKK5_9BRAD|nr:isoprenylcysteine carboxylmethyltransferase family protein [Bradyrhizobium canariense]SDR86895.1 Protein-S-isoprenylcysteine O-methyltransferase Ste14 [Bradyrhizobium canariense]
MIAKWMLQSLIWIIAMGALLFVPAGTLQWPAAWAFLGTMAIISISVGSWLAKTDPGLLAERMRLTAQDDQPVADKMLVLVFGVTVLIWFVAIGIDHRMHRSDVALALQALGLAMLLLSTVFIMWVMRENSFAAPLVKVQAERGHHVVSSGPYAWVRHPMYTGAILFVVGIPLLLGSWWGLLLSPLFAVLFAVRAGIEERTLIAGLPGYNDYTTRVRYRLLPGVW